MFVGCADKINFLPWPPRSAPMATRVGRFQAFQADAKGTIPTYIPLPETITASYPALTSAILSSTQ
jgi:hypothetical protein